MVSASTECRTARSRAIPRRMGRACAATLCLALSLLLAVFVLPLSALAETDDIEGAADELQTRVEEASARYDEITAELSELEEGIAQNTERLAEIQAQLPEQLEKSSSALVSLYKLNNESASILTMLLSADSLGGFLRNLEYVTRVTEKHNAQLQTLTELSNEAALKQEELSTAYAQIESRKAEAEEALNEAIAAHEQAIAAAKAKAEADLLAAQEAAANESAKAQDTESTGEGSDEGTDEQSSDAGITLPESDGVTGTETREEFVSQWAGRIDAYLAGSALAGQGTVFAEAAWDYGVDPRFSPAISCVESSKGDVCFRSHNAWGWGSVEWDSWDEAIRSHVAGLARGYGYTVSVEGAQKYCPPNWSFWYSRVSQEMNSI